MPKPAIHTLYHGELLTIRQLKVQLRICCTTLKRWRLQGRLCEATIDSHLARLADERRLREQARSNGVRDSTRRMRVYRGWSHEAAALDWREVLP